MQDRLHVKKSEHNKNIADDLVCTLQKAQIYEASSDLPGGNSAARWC